MTSPLDKLVHELGKLPSIGEKTALRLALYILRQPVEYGQSIAKALNETLLKVSFCEKCCNISESLICDICNNPSRSSQQICVVEDIADLVAVEKTHSFRGKYHVLHGALSPIDGVGPDDLKVRELIQRIKVDEEIDEIVLATNPNVNGDATALYIARLLKPFENIKVTKLASGIPVGGHIEYIDQNTLSKAFERRVRF